MYSFLVQTTQKISTVVDQIFRFRPPRPNHTKNFYCCRFLSFLISLIGPNHTKNFYCCRFLLQSFRLFCPNHTKNFYCCRLPENPARLAVQTTQKISTVVDQEYMCVPADVQTKTKISTDVDWTSTSIDYCPNQDKNFYWCRYQTADFLLIRPNHTKNFYCCRCQRQAIYICGPNHTKNFYCCRFSVLCSWFGSKPHQKFLLL